MVQNKLKPLWTKSGLLIATDFVRIEHGGRGDYIEISPFSICINNLFMPINKMWKLGKNIIDYLEFRSLDKYNIKVYYQVATQYSYIYADYNIGMYYVSPKDIFRKKPVNLDDF